MCSPLARPVVQHASLQKIHVFHLSTWSSSLPALRLVLSFCMAVATDIAVDLEIRKVINTPPVT